MPKHHSPIGVVITGRLSEEVTPLTGAMLLVWWNERGTEGKAFP